MRFALTVALILTASLSQAADGNDAKAQQCEDLGAIVTQLVDLRQDGKREKRAIRTLTKGKTAVEEKYLPVVQFLSGWIYSLTEDELTYEPGKKYAEACLKQ